jgi:hypothetical protein
MTPESAWAAYSASILGREVADPAEAFAALAEAERNAWAAVAALVE